MSLDFAGLKRSRRISTTMPSRFRTEKTVLVNVLSEGQCASVLQLPVIQHEQSVNVHAEKALAPAADLAVTA